MAAVSPLSIESAVSSCAAAACIGDQIMQAATMCPGSGQHPHTANQPQYIQYSLQLTHSALQGSLTQFTRSEIGNLFLICSSLNL